MASAPKLLEQMRGNQCGHRRREVIAVLEHFGYLYDREANHGSLYVHPELSRHPDLAVRLSRARVLIPKGREMPEYVARDVVAAIDTLKAWSKERANGDP
jgi:hypothetical protein